MCMVVIIKIWATPSFYTWVRIDCSLNLHALIKHPESYIPRQMLIFSLQHLAGTSDHMQFACSRSCFKKRRSRLVERTGGVLRCDLVFVDDDDDKIWATRYVHVGNDSLFLRSPSPDKHLSHTFSNRCQYFCTNI